MKKTLDQLGVGQSSKIVKINCEISLKRRLFELGLLIDEYVKVLAKSPFKNTYLLSVKNYTLALRKSILQNIYVEMK